MAVSGLPDLTGKSKQAFTILTPVDFGQPVFTGKAVTPKRKAGGSNPPRNVIKASGVMPLVFLLFHISLIYTIELSLVCVREKTLIDFRRVAEQKRSLYKV